MHSTGKPANSNSPLPLETTLIPTAIDEPQKQRLLTLLGGPENLSIYEESEFLEQAGCPPQETRTLA